jgi:hypothetical protein
MKITPSLVFCIVQVQLVIAQQAIPDNVRAANTLDALSKDIVSTHMIYGISETTGNVVGSVYLDDQWQKTFLTIRGSDRVMGPFLCRINLQTHQLEAKESDNMKALDGSKIRSFDFVNDETNERKHFINASDDALKGKPLMGFLEVLVDGKLSLYKKVNLIIKKPDYKPALNIGSKDTRIMKSEVLYYAVANNLTEIKAVRRKDFEKIFESAADVMREYAKEKSLRLTTEKDIVYIFKQYNESRIKMN